MDTAKAVGILVTNGGKVLDWCGVYMLNKPMLPMIAVACAYGELSTTLPGSGMIFEYTMPAMGRFVAIWTTLGGYFMLVFADGGTQLVIAGLTLESDLSLFALLQKKTRLHIRTYQKHFCWV